MDFLQKTVNLAPFFSSASANSHPDMPDQKPKDALKGKIAAGLLKTAGKLPLPVAQCFGAVLGFALWLAPTEAKSTTYHNLRQCFPHKPVSWHRAMTRKSLIHTGMTTLEVAHMWTRDFWQSERYITRASGEKAFIEAIESDRGILLLIPHFGNWEITNQYVNRLASPMAMYRPAKLKAVDEIIFKSRTSANTTVVPTTTQGVKSMLKCLKTGGLTVVLPDQEPSSGRGGVFVPFFGVPALTGTFPCRLASQCKPFVAVMFGKRLGIGKGFEICVRPVHEDIYSRDSATSANAVNRAVEAVINESPEQYIWDYKRFKSRPKGEPKIYPK